MSPIMSHGGQCLHACHMAVSKKIFMTQTFKTCVYGEANFQLANFHNINFQSGVEWSGELPICKFQSTNFELTDFQHMTVNVFMHVTWQSMSSCIPHGVKCLHTYHMVVNVLMHVTWCQRSPCMLRGSQCLHACHMVSNVSTHITWW